MKDDFTAYRLFGWQSFYFNTWKMLYHGLLASVVSNKKLVANLTESFLHVMRHSSLSGFPIFCLSLHFVNLNISRYESLEFILLGSHGASYHPSNLERFWPLFLEIFFLLFFISLSGTVIMCVSMLDGVTQAYEVSIWVSLHFLFLRLGKFVDIFWNSMILSLSSLNILLSISISHLSCTF